MHSLTRKSLHVEPLVLTHFPWRGGEILPCRCGQGKLHNRQTAPSSGNTAPPPALRFSVGHPPLPPLLLPQKKTIPSPLSLPPTVPSLPGRCMLRYASPQVALFRPSPPPRRCLLTSAARGPTTHARTHTHPHSHPRNHTRTFLSQIPHMFIHPFTSASDIF